MLMFQKYFDLLRKAIKPYSYFMKVLSGIQVVHTNDNDNSSQPALTSYTFL